MSKIVTIDNGILKVQISSFGAEMISVQKDGTQKLWCGDKNIWAGHSPILFPYCSGLRDGTVIMRGKKFTDMVKHGFAKRSEFEVVSEEKTSACFLLKENDYTLSMYPYKFNFRVLFKLEGEKVGVYYMVENTDSVKIPFNVGCHEAYATNGSIEDCYIEFSDDEGAVYSTCIKDSCLDKKTYKVELDGNKLHLNNNDFIPIENFIPETRSNGSIIIENIKSKRVNLYKKDEFLASVYFNDFAHLVIWTIPEREFICIEPWNGLPDLFDANYNIEDKHSIDFVEVGGVKTLYHSITF